MIRKAKNSSVVDDVDIDKGGVDDRKYSVIANEAERLMLQQENLALLRDFGAKMSMLPTGRKQEDGGLVAKTIIKKWREQASSTGFIRFLNGISADCREANMQLVLLRDAMINIHEWNVDWDKKLTPNEIRLVNNQTFWRSMILCSPSLDVKDEEIQSMTVVRNSAHDVSLLHIASPPPATTYGLTTVNPYANSHNTTHQVTRIMKDIRKCKKVAVNVVLSTLCAGDCDSFQQVMIDKGLSCTRIFESVRARRFQRRGWRSQGKSTNADLMDLDPCSFRQA
jgi:hypothetical protein